MLNDPLANALSKIMNSKKIGKNVCIVKPGSKVIKKVLSIMNEKGYIGKSKEIDDKKGGMIQVNLLGKINKCGVIKPRYSVKKGEYEKFEKRYLPAKNFGILLVSTTKGIIDHIEAKKKNIGGILFAYCY